MEFTNFETITKSSIIDQITRDLKGKQYQDLIWNYSDHISIEPIYTQDENIAPIHLNIAETGWQIAQMFKLKSVKEDQILMLNELNEGVNALYLDCANLNLERIADLEQLFKDISMEHIEIHWRNLNENNRILIEQFLKNRKSFGTYPSPSSRKLGANIQNIVVEINAELTEALLLDAVETVVNIGNSDINQLQDIYFEVEVGNLYFIELSKLRALRLLWDGIVARFNLQLPAKIIAITKIQVDTEGANHTNLLRTTTEAMSAVLGGCDTLLVMPFDGNIDQVMSRRLAKNIQLILKEESGFEYTVNPAKGSNYIESLTHQIAEKSWNKYQSKI